jgi:hypothetical protein
MLTTEPVANLLHSVTTQGFRISAYLLSNKVHHVSKGETLEPMQTVAADGTCAVSLAVSDPEGYTTFTLQTFAPEARGAQASVSVDEHDFDPNPTLMVPRLLQLAGIVNLHLPVRFGWGDHEFQLDCLEEHLRFDRIAALAWANLFGREMVRRIGEERLRALPVHEIRMFKQGALCLLTPQPGQPLAPEQADQIRAQWPGCVLPIF